MDDAAPAHCPMSQFPVQNNELTIGGIPLGQLAARVGSTPFYAYDRELISERVALLRQHLPEELFIHYAIKANPMPALLSHIAPQVDGLDVSSFKEMTTALDTGMQPDNISFSGPGKSEKEISCAVAAGIVINVESERELQAVIAAGIKLDIKPKVAIRVNPDFELKGLKIRMGGATAFGVDPEQVPHLLTQLEQAQIECEGFHIFAGSQNLNADLAVEMFRNAFALIYRLANLVKTPLRSIKIGGGFGIPYFPGDKPLDLAKVGQNLRPILAEARTHLPQTRFVMELGRYLVGEAGIYVSRIIDRKVNRGQTFLVTDGGMHHHLAASGNFGQVIRKNYPVAVGNRMDDARTEQASVVGPLCTSLDLLADKIPIAPAMIGDLIVVFQSGAYGLTASPTDFLSHPRPVEILQ